ncbi:MAG: nicotinate (nicotinamide) nucleotide adenylyltransferase [Parachlamydiales bacterium]
MTDSAFFGGSFDPIHLGHINLAIEIKEKLKLKKIIFCPAYISPFKQNNQTKASAKDRYEMVKYAIKDIQGFEVTDIEIEKEKISYTIDTLNQLNEELRLIITEDALDTFHLWKDYKQILNKAPLIVGARNNVLHQYKSKHFTLREDQFVKTNVFEISSSDIRNRLKKRLYCAHLLPKEVLDYICKSKLYL